MRECRGSKLHVPGLPSPPAAPALPRAALWPPGISAQGLLQSLVLSMLQTLRAEQRRASGQGLSPGAEAGERPSPGSAGCPQVTFPFNRQGSPPTPFPGSFWDFL